MFDSIEAYIHLHLYERKQGFSPTRMHFRSKDLITCGYPPFFYTSCDEFMCVLCCSHILCCCRGTAESGVALKPPLLTPSSYVFKSPFSPMYAFVTDVRTFVDEGAFVDFFIMNSFSDTSHKHGHWVHTRNTF